MGYVLDYHKILKAQLMIIVSISLKNTFFTSGKLSAAVVPDHSEDIKGPI